MIANVGRLIVSLVMLMLLPLFRAPAPDEYPLHDESVITKTLRFSGPSPHTLDARVLSGVVHVVGYDGTDVQLDARKRISAETDEALRAAQHDVVIETTGDAGTLAAIVRDAGGTACGEPSANRSPAWWDRPQYAVVIDFTIRVPRDTRVRLCAVNGRDVRLDDTSGDFEIQDINGGITLDRVRGSGRATTVNDAVVATFTEAPRSASLFKTVNGGITVTLPADASADLQLKTFHGGLFTDFDVVAGGPMAVPAPERRNGKYVYRSRPFTAVRVGHGGPELTFDAFNGDVRVLRAPR